MAENQIFNDKFYSERENLVRNLIGLQLEQLKEQLKQLYSPCMTRLMNAEREVQADKDLTIDDLLKLDPSERQMIVTATMYNDALWRLEAAYLMLSVGLLNVAYANLRSCLETIISAHIVENIESESVTFLRGERINQAKIAAFLPEQWDEDIKQIKNKLGEWGVHSGVESILIGVFCSPNTLDKMISETKTNKPQVLHPEFSDFAKTCINAVSSICLIFHFLINKGTNYRRDTATSG